MKEYENGLYTLECGENDYDKEYVAIIDGMVHQDSDPLRLPVYMLIDNLYNAKLTKVA